MRIQAQARVFLGFHVRAVTGLHIGGRTGGIEIGGLDNPVIRDPLTNRPLIPGSSLKGKMRSLLEKHHGLAMNRRIGQTRIHSCSERQDYQSCKVCRVFGIPGEERIATPTRLLVRDILLTDDSAERLEGFSLDRPYTEVKTEVAIDRITSAANPRPLERVPAGAEFGPGEMVYTIYSGNGEEYTCDPKQDVEFLGVVFEGMGLLEQDYLGGSGSRGSGKVAFGNITLELRTKEDYFQKAHPIGKYKALSELLSEQEKVVSALRENLGV